MMAVIPVAGDAVNLMVLPEREHVSLTLATDGAGLRTGVDLPPAQARAGRRPGRLRRCSGRGTQ